MSSPIDIDDIMADLDRREPPEIDPDDMVDHPGPPEEDAHSGPSELDLLVADLNRNRTVDADEDEDEAPAFNFAAGVAPAPGFALDHDGAPDPADAVGAGHDGPRDDGDDGMGGFPLGPDEGAPAPTTAPAIPASDIPDPASGMAALARIEAKVDALREEVGRDVGRIYAVMATLGRRQAKGNADLARATADLRAILEALPKSEKPKRPGLLGS